MSVSNAYPHDPDIILMRCLGGPMDGLYAAVPPRRDTYRMIDGDYRVFAAVQPMNDPHAHGGVGSERRWVLVWKPALDHRGLPLMPAMMAFVDPPERER